MTDSPTVAEAREALVRASWHQSQVELFEKLIRAILDESASQSRPVPERKKSSASQYDPRRFLWSCQGCGEPLEDEYSGAWRWEGERWAHKCPNAHPQSGHCPARCSGERMPRPDPGQAGMVEAACSTCDRLRSERDSLAAALKDGSNGQATIRELTNQRDEYIEQCRVLKREARRLEVELYGKGTGQSPEGGADYGTKCERCLGSGQIMGYGGNSRECWVCGGSGKATGQSPEGGAREAQVSAGTADDHAEDCKRCGKKC